MFNQDKFESLLRLTTQQTGILKSIQHTLGAISARFRGGSAGASAGPVKPPGSGGEAGLAAMAGQSAMVLGTVAAVIAAVAAALAAIPVVVLGIVAASERFVRALNPSAIEMYERATADLHATIGYGLQPVIAYATRAIKDWAGLLLPVTRALLPAMERLSAATAGVAFTFGRVAAEIAGRMVTFIAGLLPAFQRFAGAITSLTEWAGFLTAGFLDLVNMISGDLPIFDLLSKAAHGFAVAATVATAALFKLAGASGALGAFRKWIEKSISDRKNPAAGLTAAPQDAGVTAFEDVAKRLASAAFVATSAAPTKKSDTDILEEMLEYVKIFEKDTLGNVIRSAIEASFPKTTAAVNDARAKVDDLLGPRSALGRAQGQIEAFFAPINQTIFGK